MRLTITILEVVLSIIYSSSACLKNAPIIGILYIYKYIPPPRVCCYSHTLPAVVCLQHYAVTTEDNTPARAFVSQEET